MVQNMNKLTKYYCYGIIPSFLIFIVIALSTEAMYGVFFLIGFFWPYMYYTPGFEEKALSKNYRFSFLGTLYRFQTQLFKVLPRDSLKMTMPIARFVIPFLFAGVINLLNPSFTSLWVVLGWLAFEMFMILDSKKAWGFFNEKES